MKRFLAVFLACLFVMIGVAKSGAAGPLENKGNFGISGWLVYWNPKSMETYERYAAMIDRVYPEWYIVGEDGMPRSNEFNVAQPEDTAVFLAKKRKTVQIAKANGIQVFSMIVNYDKAIGEHSSKRVEMFLDNSELRKRHIQALVNNAVKDGADGIDIDYENLKATDASGFSSFMAELKDACRHHGLLLAAALPPKSDANGTWDGNQAADYRALGQSLDLIRPMTYDEHWSTSTAGPVSSPEFTEMVDRYAASVSDPSKIEVGLAGYGYDWKGKEGRSLPYDDYIALIKKFKVVPRRDVETKEVTFRYQDGADAREVWFCDAGSYRPKYDIIRRYHLGGLALWYFGSEDPAFWQDVKQFKYAKDWK